MSWNRKREKIEGEEEKKCNNFHNLALFHLEEKKKNRWLREEGGAVSNREPSLGSGEVRLRECCLDKERNGEKEKETTPCKALVVFWFFIDMCRSALVHYESS